MGKSRSVQRMVGSPEMSGTLQRRVDGSLAIALGVGFVAVLAHLPALKSYWCLDDWGQLGRAAGVLPSPHGMPARWLSQHAWWSMTWPVFGANAVAHAWLRVLLHAIAAGFVARIAFRCGLNTTAQFAAGALFAATPIAFTPVFWASGIQELLGGTLALIAVERWLSGGRTSVLVAAVCTLGSILSKESGLALPVYFLASLIVPRGADRRDAKLKWVLSLSLLSIACVEANLVLGHFATGAKDHYAVGGPLVVIGNLGKFGWWLPTPGPVFTGQVAWPQAIAGLGVFAGWCIYGVVASQRGRKLPLVALGMALASLLPALPLVNQANPYMAYLAAAAGALTLASLYPPRIRGRLAAGIAMAVVAVIWGQLTMRGRIQARAADGLPADPVVRATEMSRDASAALRAQLPVGFAGQDRPLVVFQPRLSAQAIPGATPADGALETPRYNSLLGAVGAQLVSGLQRPAAWSASLLDAPADAFVVCEKGNGFQAWGSTGDALLNAAELHVIAGNFAQAAAHLERALALGGTDAMRMRQPDILGVAPARLGPRITEFRSWLDSAVAHGEISREHAQQFRRFPAGE